MLKAAELSEIRICKRNVLVVSCALCIDCCAVTAGAVVAGYIIIRITCDKRCGIFSAHCKHRFNIMTENLCHDLNKML